MSSDERSLEPTPPIHRRIIVTSSTDTVVLKQLVPTDAPEYFNRVEEDRAHLSQQHGPRTADSTAENYPTVESVLESIVNPKIPNKIRFGIWDGDVFVGSNNLSPRGEGRAELGSWVGGNYTGHNYAARARTLLVDYAFNTAGLEEVFCEIAVGNEASRKSVERSGFKFNGVRYDHWVYTLHRSEALNTLK